MWASLFFWISQVVCWTPEDHFLKLSFQPNKLHIICWTTFLWCPVPNKVTNVTNKISVRCKTVPIISSAISMDSCDIFSGICPLTFLDVWRFSPTGWNLKELETLRCGETKMRLMVDSKVRVEFQRQLCVSWVSVNMLQMQQQINPPVLNH